MSFDASQEAEVTITGTVRRLVPCAYHAAAATGEQSWRGGKPYANPNGYRHDCPACAATPTHEEALESVDG